MSTPQRAPRSRSAFAAAFLSLLFPGLGHAYAGAYTRALGFAAAPLLVLALGGGVVLRSDRAELAGMVASEGALIAIFIANILALVYRIIAAVDAWQVARFLNASDAAGSGRLGRARMPVHPLSIAGLRRRDPGHRRGPLRRGAATTSWPTRLVNCVFGEDGGDDCGDATDPPTALRDRRAPEASRRSGRLREPAASPTAVIPTPDPSAQGTLAPTLPPWDGKERLNILARRRGCAGRRVELQHRHPDRGLHRPRDQAGRDVPGAARHGRTSPSPTTPGRLWGSVYARQDQQLVQPEPQPQGPVAGQERADARASTRSRPSSASSTAWTSATTSRSTSGASATSSTPSVASRSTCRSRSTRASTRRARATSPGCTSRPARST